MVGLPRIWQRPELGVLQRSRQAIKDQATQPLVRTVSDRVSDGIRTHDIQDHNLAL